MNKKTSQFILRTFLGITFIWIGVLVLKSPSAWGASLSEWAYNFLPDNIEGIMISNGIFDIVVGLWLIIGYRVWIAGLLASIHLAVVLVVTGFNPITIRDIGLLGAALYLFLENKKLKIKI